MRQTVLRNVLAFAGLGLVGGLAQPADDFALATSRPAGPVARSFFGIHGHSLVAWPSRNGGKATAWPVLPIGGVRLWDTYVRWADIAPARNVWTWNRLDALVNLAAAHGADVIYPLGSTPAWASARPEEPCTYGKGCAAEPADMAVYEDYVRTVVRRYKGRIQVYELWNEPKFYEPATDGARPRGFFSGTLNNMLEMARIARRVIDAEDPKARLATPGFDGGSKRVEQFLQAGGGAIVDIVAYHFYARGAAEFVAQVVAVRAAMQRHGAAELPLWNTESGFEASDGSGKTTGAPGRGSREDAAGLLAQTLILAAASGVERFFVYAWDHGLMGMVDGDGRALPNHAAYARAQDWLLNARMEGCRQPEAGVVACDGTKAGQRFTIAWSLDESRSRQWMATPPAGLRLISTVPLMAAGGNDAQPLSEPAGTVVRLGQQPLLLSWGPTR